MAKRKIRKPKDFNMPNSGAPVADVGTTFDRYVQFYGSGTYEAKTVRRLATWLNTVADWMEQGTNRQTPK